MACPCPTYKRIIFTKRGNELMNYMRWGEGFEVRPSRNPGAREGEYVIQCQHSYDKRLVDKLVKIFNEEG